MFRKTFTSSIHKINLSVLNSSFVELVYAIQLKYYRKVRDNVASHSLLNKVMEMGRNTLLRSGHTTKCKVMKHIDKVLEKNDNAQITQDMINRKNKIAKSTKTKTVLYRQWSPDLLIHDAYVTRKHFPEYWRISWTRFRLGSTNLPCEKKRWRSDGNRIDGNRETPCICGGIQSEQHLLLDCDERIIRANSFEELFGAKDQRQTMKGIHDTLKKFEKR